MPMTRAARAFCDVARIAWPMRERLRKTISAAPASSAAAKATSLIPEMVTAPSSRTSVPKPDSAVRTLAPNNPFASCCRRMLKP